MPKRTKRKSDQVNNATSESGRVRGKDSAAEPTPKKTRKKSNSNSEPEVTLDQLLTDPAEDWLLSETPVSVVLNPDGGYDEVSDEEEFEDVSLSLLLELIVSSQRETQELEEINQQLTSDSKKQTGELQEKDVEITSLKEQLHISLQQFNSLAAKSINDTVAMQAEMSEIRDTVDKEMKELSEEYLRNSEELNVKLMHAHRENSAYKKQIADQAASLRLISKASEASDTNKLLLQVAQNNQLKNQMAQLQHQNAGLQSVFSDLQHAHNQNAQSQSQIAYLKNQNAQLQRQNDELLMQISNLNNQVAQLQSQNQRPIVITSSNNPLIQQSTITGYPTFSSAFFPATAPQQAQGFAPPPPPPAATHHTTTSSHTQKQNTEPSLIDLLNHYKNLNNIF